MKLFEQGQLGKYSITMVLLCALGFYGTPLFAGSLSASAKNYYYGIGVPQNLTKAFQLYLAAAEGGDLNAMFVVGGMYMQGQGTLINQAEAFKWLYKAAVNGRSSKESQRILGQSFVLGTHVPQNYTEALKWYELAANNGDSVAQSELAFMYFYGKYVDKNYDKAFYWFDIAAHNGLPLAQYNLGLLWYTGNGVPAQDLVKAYSWFNVAAANGHSDGTIAKAYLETILSNSELEKAQTMSTALFKKIQNKQK